MQVGFAGGGVAPFEVAVLDGGGSPYVRLPLVSLHQEGIVDNFGQGRCSVVQICYVY